MPNNCNDTGSLNDPQGSAAQIGTNNPALKPYSVPEIQIGEWQITSLNPDDCANSDQLRQETYVAESLNIAGAPINIFKLLGVHEQNSDSLVKKQFAQTTASATWNIEHDLGDTVSVTVISNNLPVTPLTVVNKPRLTTLTFASAITGTATLTARNLISSAVAVGYPLSNINADTPSFWKSFQTSTAVSSSYIGIDFGIRKLDNGRSRYEPQKPRLVSVGSITITQSNSLDEYAKQVRVDVSDGTVVIGQQSRPSSNVGNGQVINTSLGSDASQGELRMIASSATSFSVMFVFPNNLIENLGTLTVGVPFNSVFMNLTVIPGTVAFVAGDMISFALNYDWKRAGLFNLVRSSDSQVLNFKAAIAVKAIKISPTLFTGAGSWAVSQLDFFSSPKTDVNNIQDLFFGENRDRDYEKTPVLIKAQYSPTDSIADLSKFGISILDQYSFTAAFSTIVKALGRPIVVGDIIEVIPEMQYDQNLKPIRKFLEVTDTSWASEGFSTLFKPTLIRFVAQQALPSQETRDIFGTIDTQKYLVADSVLTNTIGEQIDTTPLTQTEEIKKEAQLFVPETGTDDAITIKAVIDPVALPPINERGNPKPASGKRKQNSYIEDGLPPDGLPYGEGFKLPDTVGLSDGDYFRLYYPPETKIPPRLYRYSAMKNRWIYQETDRRGDYSSHKPTVRSILESKTKIPLRKKDV